MYIYIYKYIYKFNKRSFGLNIKIIEGIKEINKVILYFSSKLLYIIIIIGRLIFYNNYFNIGNIN